MFIHIRFCLVILETQIEVFYEHNNKVAMGFKLLLAAIPTRLLAATPTRPTHNPHQILLVSFTSLGVFLTQISLAVMKCHKNTSTPMHDSWDYSSDRGFFIVSIACHDIGPQFLNVSSERPTNLISKSQAFCEEAVITYFWLLICLMWSMSHDQSHNLMITGQML